jgi:hypothetical protein
MYGHQDLHWKDSRLYLGSCATGNSITPDTKYPSMWRVRYPDGSLSDIVNLTRARDGARCLALAVLNTRETRVAASPTAQNAQGVVTSPPSKWQPKPTQPHIPQVPCPSNPVRGVMNIIAADGQGRQPACRSSVMQ